jgi:phosphoribosylformimino-5-aminoimidazole carboxamide ribotide isomerase
VILFPAVDIRGGKAVRLRRGDFDQQTVYEDDPFEAAKAWVQAGARWLHVVDLDGAKTGTPANLHHVERIARELDVPVQVGGGLRTVEAVRDALEAGAARVILGTAAYTDVDFLDDVVGAYGERVIVSVDVRGGRVTTAGWTETTQMPAEAVFDRLRARGVRTFVYSNVDRDGMLGGVDLDEIRRIADIVRGRFLYSGGVGSLDDLAAIAALRQVNLAGVIVGKALFERRFTVAEGQAVLEGRDPAAAGDGGAAGDAAEAGAP